MIVTSGKTKEFTLRVHLIDEFGPEASAMLQALYSRSASSVTEHVKKVHERGSDQFMASYYVGYGHASIGDCGVTTLYLEDVSLLACKAVQDTPLYSGQETSTRYIDFSRQRICDPAGTQQSGAYLRRWVDFYVEVLDALNLEFKARFPLDKGNPGVWEKAVSARALDVARSFLPAGVTSQVSWTTNLRQAHEHLSRLENHPLAEVRLLAAQCRRQLAERYPNSFGHEADQQAAAYCREVCADEFYSPPPAVAPPFEVSTALDNERLEREALAVIAERPRKSLLPKTLARFGHYTCKFALDFGSFRDLQRHRGGLCRMPLLTTGLGFNEWYFEQMSDDLRTRAQNFVNAQLDDLQSFAGALSKEALQYYIPMGMNVACELIYDLPQMVYVAELRSGRTVHPTLRAIAQRMALFLQERHPKLALYADLRGDAFRVQRGLQDIVERGA